MQVYASIREAKKLKQLNAAKLKWDIITSWFRLSPPLIRQHIKIISAPLFVMVIMTSIADWETAVLEFFNETKVSASDQKRLLGTTRSAEVVKQAVESNYSTGTQYLFIAAVSAAGTHKKSVKHVSVRKSMPPIVTGPVAAILRVTDAFGTLHQFKGTGYFPGAFVYGAVQVMVTAADKHMELFLSLSSHFAEVNMQLRRLDSFLVALQTTDKSIWSSIRVLIDLLRICGRVTNYIKGIEFAFLILKTFS